MLLAPARPTVTALGGSDFPGSPRDCDFVVTGARYGPRACGPSAELAWAGDWTALHHPGVWIHQVPS